MYFGGRGYYNVKGSRPEPLWVVESPAKRNSGGSMARVSWWGKAEVRERRNVRAVTKYEDEDKAMLHGIGTWWKEGKRLLLTLNVVL
jgi:hypothetical protein